MQKLPITFPPNINYYVFNFSKNSYFCWIYSLSHQRISRRWGALRCPSYVTVMVGSERVNGTRSEENVRKNNINGGSLVLII